MADDVESASEVSAPTLDRPAIILIPRKHRVEFESLSQSGSFEAHCQGGVFSSASQSVILKDTDNPTAIGFILLEDGTNLLLEDGQTVFREENL